VQGLEAIHEAMENKGKLAKVTTLYLDSSQAIV